jgi:soluble lytic murein transglycosylase
MAYRSPSCLARLASTSFRLGECPLAIARFGLIGALALGCKCAPVQPSPPALDRSAASSVAVVELQAPLVTIEPTLVTLNRSRRFLDAKSLLDGLPGEVAVQPIYRFVAAYLGVHTDDGTRSLSLLEGLETQLADLAPDVEILRAQARLLTVDALVGAEWLDAHGQGTPEVWFNAAKTLQRLGRCELALPVVDKAIGALGLAANVRGIRRLADLRALRAQLHEACGAPERGLDDLRWLAVEAPAHGASRERVARAMDEQRLRLEPAQELKRIRRMADAGWVERVDIEAPPFGESQPRLVGPGMIAYFLGRARQVSRTDQLEGARLLARAAEHRAEDPTQLRLDAARLYTREGDVRSAISLYDRAARRDRSRREEAEYYAARVAAMLGEPERGVERYRRLLEDSSRGRFSKLAELDLALLVLAMGDFGQAERRLHQLATQSDDQELVELEGVVATQLGKKDIAVERYRSVIKRSPLSVAGQFAAARLQALSPESVVAVAERPARPRADPPKLSRRVDQLLALGLDELAASAQRIERSAAPRSSGREAIQSSCRIWDKIGYGEAGFVESRALRESLELSEPASDDSRWLWECRFPRPYAPMVERAETEFRLPKDLLYAVMRQESGFDLDVVSPAGAVGLLQLMPETARRVAAEIGFEGKLSLDDPATNLRLGAAYLRKLLDIFNQDLILTVAGYNAGPSAVALWLRHANSSLPELFAARIPYAETQKYVERVISNLAVYRYLYGSVAGLPELSLVLPRAPKVTSGLY